MPFYEYACRACGAETEELQKMSDPALTDCPACGQAALERLVSAAGFRLAGGGWYETDFKAGKKKNLAQGGEGTPGGKAGEATVCTPTGCAKPGCAKTADGAA